MFQVLHSSAGAGKTHALVKHYLGLALAGDDAGAYVRILALTFTNKAANEMRERILRYLRGLAGDAPNAALTDVRDTIAARRASDRTWCAGVPRGRSPTCCTTGRSSPSVPSMPSRDAW